MIHLALWLVSACVVAFFVGYLELIVLAILREISMRKIESPQTIKKPNFGNEIAAKHIGLIKENTRHPEPYIVGTATAEATAKADAAEARGLAQLKAYAESKTRGGQ